MKKLLVLVAFLGVGFIYQSATAQVRVSVNINTRPVWAPADYMYVDNYYFPEYDMYYDVRARHYRYLDRGRWIYTPSIPDCYRSVDFGRARRVVIHEHNPYLRHNYWREKYRDNRRDFRDYRRDDRGRDNWDRRDNDRNDRGNGRYSEHRGDRGRHK